MKTLIVISSTYLGNTMKIANAMAEQIKATVQTPEDIYVSDIASYDLIGFGSGINFASHSKQIISFVENAPLQGKKAFIFSTRCRPVLGQYHKKLKKLIVEKGGILLGEFSCVGFDRTGPWVGMNGYNKDRPNSKDMFKAGLFALKMRKQAHPLFNIKKLYPIVSEIDGLPMRKNGVNEVVGNIVALNTTSCIKCGKCVEACPLNVFESREGDTAKQIIPVREMNCIMCENCEKTCPTNSIFINESFHNGLRILVRGSSSAKLQSAYWNRTR